MADAIRVARERGAPDDAADLASITASEIRHTVAEAVCAGRIGLRVAVAVAHAFPLRVGREVPLLSIHGQVVHVEGDCVAGFAHVRDAEAVEGRALLLESGREVHGDRAVDRVFRVVPGERVGELPVAARAVRVVVEFPFVAHTFAQRCGAKFTGNEMRHELAAALVFRRDEPHREAGAGALGVEVHGQRIGRSRRLWLLIVEEAEAHAARACGLCEGECAGRGEPILERARRQLDRVKSQPARARHASADFARLAAGKVCFRRIAEILRDGARLLGDDAIVHALPAGIAVEVLALQRRLRRLGGAGKGDAGQR